MTMVHGVAIADLLGFGMMGFPCVGAPIPMRSLPAKAVDFPTSEGGESGDKA